MMVKIYPIIVDEDSLVALKFVCHDICAPAEPIIAQVVRVDGRPYEAEAIAQALEEAASALRKMDAPSNG